MARSNGNLVSINVVVNSLMQNPLLKDISYEFIVSRTVELLGILHHPSLYLNKRERLNVVSYKALKPNGIRKIDGIMRVDKERPIRLIHSEDIAQEHLGDGGYKPYRNEDTYTVNDTYFNLNFEKGEIDVFYKAIATDENCYPLVLDDAVLLRCIESYIKYKYFDILNDMDLVSDRKLDKAEKEYLFNAGQADTALKIPSEDEMEALTNLITQALPSTTEFNRRMEFLGSQEFRRIH